MRSSYAVDVQEFHKREVFFQLFVALTPPAQFSRVVAVYPVKFDGNFKNAVLWSQCPLGFVCMEPWNGFPGSLTTPEHETLAPGNALSAVMSIEI